MRACLFFLCFAVAACAQQAAAPKAPPATPANFYHDYQISPIGDGTKVLIVLESGGQKASIIVEPVTPKDGGPVVQYVLYANGGVTLYEKTEITLPGPSGGDGTRVEGISVTHLPVGNAPAQATAPSGHRSSSSFTTPPRNDPNFRIPMRFEKAGFGGGRPRMWIFWDGQHEIEVEPTDSNFKGNLLNMLPLYNLEQWATGNLNHIKYVSNRYTEGSTAPRYFYLKRNKDDSISVYGDDDLAKLKAIEKKKESR